MDALNNQGTERFTKIKCNCHWSVIWAFLLLKATWSNHTNWEQNLALLPFIAKYLKSSDTRTFWYKNVKLVCNGKAKQPSTSPPPQKKKKKVNVRCCQYNQILKCEGRESGLSKFGKENVKKSTFSSNGLNMYIKLTKC